MFTDRDKDPSYKENNSVFIHLNGDSVSCDSAAVNISGTTATISQEGVYVVSGTLNDGTILVDADEKAKIQIVLKDASISCATSAPLCVLGGDKVFVTLAEGTENTLSNGGTFTAVGENNIDGTVYSKQDLTFNGSGSLTVNSPAGHGIVCKDDLVFTGGSYAVTATGHGLDANDSVRITGATLSIDAGKDGIHAENTEDTTLGFFYLSGGSVDVDAEGDGVSAGAFLQISGGAVKVLAGGGSANAQQHTSQNPMGGGMHGGGRPGFGPRAVQTAETTESSTSMKGLKATGNILVSDGAVTIDSADDAIHANGSITVNGGTFSIASGDDGFHADENLSICAGTVAITESYEGLEALNIAISGGNITLKASDDGLNAAGGNDDSGNGGIWGGDQFGRPDKPGGMGGEMGGSSDGSVVISGGNLNINASGDGIDANGTLTISGGKTVLTGPTRGDTAVLDYDLGGTVTGGTFIGTGSSMMAQSFTEASQGVIAVSVGNQPAGTQITVTDGSGNTLLSHTPEESYQVLIFTSPDIKKGEAYTIAVGQTSGTIEAT